MIEAKQAIGVLVTHQPISGMRLCYVPMPAFNLFTTYCDALLALPTVMLIHILSLQYLLLELMGLCLGPYNPYLTCLVVVNLCSEDKPTGQTTVFLYVLPPWCLGITLTPNELRHQR